MLVETFYSKVTLRPDGCWDFEGTLDRNGYRRCGLNRKWTYAHIVSYLLHFGPTPEGTVIDHTCRNRWCVNPHHLEAVTQRVNVHRGAANGGLRPDKATHCPHGHEFTRANTYTYKGARRCRACMKIRKRKSRELAVVENNV